MRNSLKNLALLLLLLAAFALPGMGQTTDSLHTNVYAAGVSYNPGASPAIAGTGLYAHKLSDAGTYAFTVVDALPKTFKPFTVSTNFSGGIAQKIISLGKFPIYVPTAVGVSYTGTNTGWAWSTGGMTVVELKGHDHLRLLPNVRLLKSSISDYNVIVGFLVAWGE